MSTILGILFAGLAVVFRFVPHPANFTPVGALFIFFAARMKLRWSVFAMAALAATDLVLGTYDPRLMLIVYASFAAMGFLSRAAAQRGGAWRLGFGVLAGSTLFYLTTNFAVWILSPWYTHDLSGLYPPTPSPCRSSGTRFSPTSCGAGPSSASMYGSPNVSRPRRPNQSRNPSAPRPKP